MKHLLLAATCAVLAACSQTDEPEVLPVAIGFTPTVDAQTRGEDWTASTLPSFGVFASLTQGGDFNQTSSTLNFMHNQRVNKSGTWTYNPVKYWPNNATDKLSFFAYAPYGDSSVTLPPANSTGFPTLTYNVPQTEADQIDLLAATPLMNQTYTTAGGSGSVSFKMNHALTKVIFKVKNEAGANISVSNFTLKGKASGTLKYHNPASGGSANGFSWNNITGSSTVTFTGKASSASPVTVPSTATTPTNIATFYMLPDKSSSTFTITYKIGSGSEKTLTDEALPATPAWTAGAVVSYTMTIKPGGISEVTASVSGKWADGGSGGSAASKYLVLGADDLKIGDFYYSDGTWSDGGYRMYSDGTTEMDASIMPDASRTVIGIVMKVGRGTNEGTMADDVDDENANNWKDEDVYRFKGSNTIMTTIRGYVLALKDARTATGGKGYFKWSTGTTSIPTDTKRYTTFCGYSNTLKIREKALSSFSSKYPAVYFATDGYMYTLTAPASSSDWFLPSSGQCWYWSKNKDVLIKSIYKVSGADGWETYYGYWSSSETTTRTKCYFIDGADFSHISSNTKNSVDRASRGWLVF